MGLEAPARRLLGQSIGEGFLDTLLDSAKAARNAIREAANSALRAIEPPALKLKPENQEPEEEEASQLPLDGQRSELQYCDAAFSDLDDLSVSMPRVGLETQEQEEERFGQLAWSVPQPEMRHRDAAFSGLDAMLGVALFVAGGRAAGWREQSEPERRQSGRKKSNDKLLLP